MASRLRCVSRLWVGRADIQPIRPGPPCCGFPTNAGLLRRDPDAEPGSSGPRGNDRGALGNAGSHSRGAPARLKRFPEPRSPRSSSDPRSRSSEVFESALTVAGRSPGAVGDHLRRPRKDRACSGSGLSGNALMGFGGSITTPGGHSVRSHPEPTAFQILVRALGDDGESRSSPARPPGSEPKSS